jgi:hypothetical protein
MTQDDVVSSYRGVLCRCCKQAIPLPAIIDRLESGSGSAIMDGAHEGSTPVFTLRCRMCEKEYPYSAVEIKRFEGLPASRLSRVKSAHATGGLSKAAHI